MNYTLTIKMYQKHTNELVLTKQDKHLSMKQIMFKLKRLDEELDRRFHTFTFEITEERESE